MVLQRSPESSLTHSCPEFHGFPQSAPTPVRCPELANPSQYFKIHTLLPFPTPTGLPRFSVVYLWDCGWCSQSICATPYMLVWFFWSHSICLHCWLADSGSVLGLGLGLPSLPWYSRSSGWASHQSCQCHHGSVPVAQTCRCPDSRPCPSLCFYLPCSPSGSQLPFPAGEIHFIPWQWSSHGCAGIYLDFRLKIKLQWKA